MTKKLDLEKFADAVVEEIHHNIREHKEKTCVRLQIVRELLDTDTLSKQPLKLKKI